MRKYLAVYLVSLFFLMQTIPAAAEQEKEPDPDAKKQVAKISEAFGHLMGKNLESLGLNFDIQYVIKGLKEAAEGKESPMTELECIEAITQAQEEAFKQQAADNLISAETFLQSNKTQKGVVLLEEGKVQYLVEKSGSGESVDSNSSPLIRYTGKFLNGSVFGQSTEDEPISLEEIIPGLKAAILGMKEGEKRMIYIHPDCAYGTKGALPPNSLLSFEIEVVKANYPLPEEAAPSDSCNKVIDAEIALPQASLEHMR